VLILWKACMRWYIFFSCCMFLLLQI